MRPYAAGIFFLLFIKLSRYRIVSTLYKVNYIFETRECTRILAITGANTYYPFRPNYINNFKLRVTLGLTVLKVEIIQCKINLGSTQLRTFIPAADACFIVEAMKFIGYCFCTDQTMAKVKTILFVQKFFFYLLECIGDLFIES